VDKDYLLHHATAGVTTLSKLKQKTNGEPSLPAELEACEMAGPHDAGSSSSGADGSVHAGAGGGAPPSALTEAELKLR